MFEKYKEYFSCPECQGALVLEIFERDQTWLRDGLFSCSNGHCYPLIDGLPTLLDPQLLMAVAGGASLDGFLSQYGARLSDRWKSALASVRPAGSSKKADTARRYEYQWQKYDTQYNAGDRAEFERLTGGTFPVDRCKGAEVIDVGCGQGRFTFVLLESGAHEVVCVDLGGAIRLALNKFRKDDRVLCVQGDVYKFPFRKKFDLALCIGVLQHLPDPSLGFGNIVNLVKQEGLAFYWCYADSWIRPFLLMARSVCLCLPDRALYVLAAVPALARWLISALGAGMRTLGLGWVSDRLPFRIYEGYGFHYLHVNTFDHLSAVIINFFHREDIEQWVKREALKRCSIIARHPGKAGAGWIIQAIKD